eukprot:7650521-Prorocentrum_lima.AAC.1
MDKERYQELSTHFKEEKTKNAELRRTWATLQSRRTPYPWNNLDPGTRPSSCREETSIPVVARRM